MVESKDGILIIHDLDKEKIVSVIFNALRDATDKLFPERLEKEENGGK